MTEETTQHTDNHDFGPGALLKRTREQKKMSLDDVSERLKLTRFVLTEIENDDFGGDLPATFYRGYLKNYAELLELDEADIAANFEQFCHKHKLFSKPATPRVEGLSLEKSVNSNNWLFKIVTGFIIIALLVAIYYLVVEKELWKKVVPAGQETEQLDNDSQGLEFDNQNDSEDTSGALSFSNSVPEDRSNSVDGNSLELSNSEGSASNEPQPSDGSLPLGATNQPSSENESLNNNQKDQASSSVASTSKSLLLNFTSDCWVRVEDATGKVLALGIKSAGTSLQLSGKTPYHLNLGKASAVELSFDGNEVDLSQYPDTRAAKLTLGDS